MTPYDARPPARMIIDGDSLEVVIFSGAGPLLRHSIEHLALNARLVPDGEILRCSYQPAPDPDAPDEPRRLVRLVVQDIPASPQDAAPQINPGTVLGDRAAETVWLGELSGFELIGDHGGQVTLMHRCGWVQVQPTEGVLGEFSPYLANLVTRARQHTCVGTLPPERTT